MLASQPLVPAGNRGLERPADHAVIRHVVRRAKRVNRPDDIGRDDVEVRGELILQVGEEFGVGAELKDGGSPRFARELRVLRLVGPRAEPAGRPDTHQNVRVSRHRPVRESRLDDDLRASSHRRQRAIRLLRERAHGGWTLVARNRDDLKSSRAKRLDIARFVLGAFPSQDRRVRVFVGRPVQRPVRDGQLESGAMAAADKRRQIGWR